MRRIYIYLIIMLLTATVQSASAQRKARKVAAKAEKVDPRIERMIGATQDIIFIDSIVVNRTDFLRQYNMNPESGTLCRYNDFFEDEEYPDSYIHINEMGNKCYYSKGDTIDGIRLYTSDMLDCKWTKGTELQGILDGERIASPNYPFMMADGTTLYFSAKGTESIGGYDIFVTRLDIENGEYLKPENIGMPFNSTANDYMYAIDELDSIGWFVTDRNQPEDKVCIYIFIPSDSRQTYATDEYTDEQIKKLARIERIADTWKDGSERKKALERLQQITTNKTRQKKNGDFIFVINDNTTYRTISDFRSKDNANKYNELMSLKSRMKILGKALENARDYYAKASIQERIELRTEILKSEQQYEEMEKQIENTEKEIRNAENNIILKKK